MLDKLEEMGDVSNIDISTIDFHRLLLPIIIEHLY